MKLIIKGIGSVIKAWCVLLVFGLCMGLMKTAYDLLMVLHRGIALLFKKIYSKISGKNKKQEFYSK